MQKRIAVKLDRETEEILKYYKQNYYEKENRNKSYVSLVNEIIEKLGSEAHEIDWISVKFTKSNKKPENNTSYSTSLSFSNTANTYIKVFSEQVKEQFDIKKVHLAFIIKNCVIGIYLIHCPYFIMKVG